jgi:hypothetical protein
VDLEGKCLTRIFVFLRYYRRTFFSTSRKKPDFQYSFKHLLFDFRGLVKPGCPGLELLLPDYKAGGDHRRLERTSKKSQVPQIGMGTHLISSGFSPTVSPTGLGKNNPLT